MGYLLLLLSIGGCTTASLCAGFFNRKNDGIKNATPIYNLVMSICALLCWAVMYFSDFSFTPGVLLYSIGFGLCYTAVTVGSIHALKCGPISLTTLITQLSGIGTSIWGFIFWDSELKLTVILGLVFVIISLVLCMKRTDKGYKPTLKWLLLASGSSLFNVGCAVIQKTQQINFDFQYGDQMMFFGMIIAVIVCTVIFLQAKPDKPLEIIKRSALFPAIAGGMNMFVNLIIILLAATSLSPSLIYPANGVGSLALTCIASRIIFKEELSTRQWLGIAVGAVAIALLSL